MKPLEGLKLVEMGVYVAVPAVTRLFSDWGAEVIKIEAPTGDNARIGGWSIRLPARPDCNPTFSLPNSGKKLVGLNLKTPEGMEIMEKLLSDADIFVSNIRYGGLTRLGLDYESLHKRYPRLICAYINGYGFEGAEKDKPGFDMTSFWAKSGILNALREPENVPKFPPPGIGDTATSGMLAAGILAAVIKQQRTGEGSKVSTSLMATGIWCNYSHVTAGQERHEPDTQAPFVTPYPFKEWHNPFYQVYRCKDGRMLFMLGGGYGKMHQTFAAMGLDDLIGDPRFVDHATMRKNSDYLYDRFMERFAQKDAKEWEEILTPLDISFEVLATNTEVSTDAQAWANGCLTRMESPDGRCYIVPNTPVDFSDMEKPQTRHAGGIGTHTRQVLESLGYTQDQVEELLAAGVAVEPK